MEQTYVCKCGHIETESSLNENGLLPICLCGEDMQLAIRNYASMARYAAGIEAERLQHEAEARMENMMLHGTEG